MQPDLSGNNPEIHEWYWSVHLRSFACSPLLENRSAHQSWEISKFVAKMCNRMYTSSLNCNDCYCSINAAFKPIFCGWIICSYRAFSLTCPGSMQIYWNKRKRLHKKRVQLPRDWFGSPTWPLFHCLGHQYGRRDVMWKYGIDVLNWQSTKVCKNGTCKPIWYNYKTWWLKKCTTPSIEPSSLAPKACTHSPKSFWCGKWQ